MGELIFYPASACVSLPMCMGREIAYRDVFIGMT